MFISVQEITQSGMTYDQISTAASVFFLYILCTRLPIKTGNFVIPRKKNENFYYSKEEK